MPLQYEMRLVRFAFIALVFCAMLYVFVAAYTAPFDERYVIALLSRHEAAILGMEYDWGLIGAQNRTFEEYNSNEYFAEKFDLDAMKDKIRELNQSVSELRGVLNLLSMPDFLEQEPMGWRSASVFKDETGVVKGRLFVMGGTMRTISQNNISMRYMCPDNTTLVLSFAEKNRYLFAGASGNRLAVVMMSERQGADTPSTSAIENFAENLNAKLAEQYDIPQSVRDEIVSKYREAISTAIKTMRFTEVWYFRPDQRADFDLIAARFKAVAEGCEAYAST